MNDCKYDDQDDDDQDDDEEMCIKADHLSPNLVHYFHPKFDQKLQIQVDTDWKPPDKHGLDNSPIIIPRYYQKKEEKLLTVDYYFMILDDIRNLRKLNKHQLQFINALENDKKQKIILELNKLFDVIQDALG